MTADNDVDYVRVKIDNGVCVLTVDRPPANALNLTLVRQLVEAAGRAAADDKVGAIVITGAGSRFVAGADIKMLRTLAPADFPEFISAIQRGFDDIEALPVPTIAAVNGHAMGGGFELALACDLRVVSESARLGLPEVKLGVLPGAGGTQRLAEIVGKGRALDILYTGRALEANEARAMGLVNQVLPREEVVAGAVEFAVELAAGARTAMREIKSCVLARLDGGRRAGFRAEADGIGRLFGGAEAAEGIAAFVEKRTPRFVPR